MTFVWQKECRGRAADAYIWGRLGRLNHRWMMAVATGQKIIDVRFDCEAILRGLQRHARRGARRAKMIKGFLVSVEFRRRLVGRDRIGIQGLGGIRRENTAHATATSAEKGSWINDIQTGKFVSSPTVDFFNRHVTTGILHFLVIYQIWIIIVRYGLGRRMEKRRATRGIVSERPVL